MQRLLGAPDESGASWIAYRGLAEICSDKFPFRFADGKLSEVEWAMVLGLSRKSGQQSARNCRSASSAFGYQRVILHIEQRSR